MHICHMLGPSEVLKALLKVSLHLSAVCNRKLHSQTQYQQHVT